MRQKSFRVLLLLAWCFLLPAFAHAQWWHTPGKADVLTTGGIANTLVVKLINLTPYDMELKEDQLGYQYYYGNPNDLFDIYDPTAKDPDQKKAFMFAPLGVPSKLPRVPPEAFTDDTYVNTTTIPYTFVLSWDDRAYTVTPDWISWTIKSVVCVDPRCTASSKDVTLGLFITRENPGSALTAKDYWSLAKDILGKVAKLAAVVIVPENPLAWKDFILSTGQIIAGVDAFTTKQNASDLGKKWYVAAYPFPGLGSYCAGQDSSNTSCSPSSSLTSSQASDAAEANWSAGNGGWTEEEIVVTLEVSRGVAPAPAYNCGGDSGKEISGELGSVPVAVVTVMTLDEWLYATTTSMADAIATGAAGPNGGTLPSNSEVTSAAQLIRSTLQQSGRRGGLTLFSVLRKLNNEQRQVLRDAYATWRAGQPLTPRQQTFLHMLAVHLRDRMEQGKER